MTLDEANTIWNACYQGTADETAEGWNLYTSEQRIEAIETRQGIRHQSFDAELARIEQRQWERDGWNLQRATRQRF